MLPAAYNRNAWRKHMRAICGRVQAMQARWEKEDVSTAAYIRALRRGAQQLLDLRASTSLYAPEAARNQAQDYLRRAWEWEHNPPQQK